MSSVLPEWYGHGDEAIKKIVTTGTIAVDTNVLLDLYRVGRKQREQILSALEAVRDRLFIPFQVALEYQSRRLSVAADSQRLYENLVDKVIALADEDLNRLRGQEQKAAVRQIVDEAREDLQRKLREMLEEHVIPFEDVQKDDPIRKALDELIDDQAIGKRPAPEVLKDLKERAEQRINDLIPPGYADAKKKEDATGDCLVWFELLEHAAKSKRPLLFVTGDKKEDWYRAPILGRSIGPRVELIAEMTTASKDQLYHHVPLDLFLDLTNSYLNTEVEETTIEAVRNLERPSELERGRETLTSQAASGVSNQLGAQEAVNAAMQAYASKLYDPSTLGRYPPGSPFDASKLGNYGMGKSLFGSPTLSESLNAQLAESLNARLAESIGMQGSQFAEVMRKQQEKMMEAVKPAFDASKITSGLLSQIRTPITQELTAQAQQAAALKTPTPTPAKQAKPTPAKKAAIPAKKTSAKKSQPRKNPAKKPRPAKENG